MDEREKEIAFIASSMCIVAGIQPIDSMDGSPNWWMFQAEAEKIVDDIRKRFPNGKSLPPRGRLS